MELKDTIEMMTSGDYKERFKAEYWQTKIRYNKLKIMLRKWDNKQLNFTPTCDRGIFDRQLDIMGIYIELLEDRAQQEGIDLDD